MSAGTDEDYMFTLVLIPVQYPNSVPTWEPVFVDGRNNNEDQRRREIGEAGGEFLGPAMRSKASALGNAFMQNPEGTIKELKDLIESLRENCLDD